MPEWSLRMPGVLYLHGFCSSSKSSKGVFLAGRFAEIGVDVALPDLDEGDFQATTLTKQLAVVTRLAQELKPSMLIGSSLGGYIAALFGAREPGAIPAVAVMAPAFDFARRLGASLGEDLGRWRRDGYRDFYHYRNKAEVPLSYTFYEDAARYEAFPDVKVPVKVLHGLQDSVADPKLSTEFARHRSNVDLEWLDTDHQMLDVTDRIWASMIAVYRRSEPTGGAPTRSLAG